MSEILIIGSGLGGLECGSILSRRGHHVTVLESQIQPGGCMQSFRRHGHILDTGLHYVGGLDQSQPLYESFRDLGLLELPWERMDEDAFERITISGHTYSLAQGYEHFVQTLLQDFPSEEDSLRRYIQLMQCTDEAWMQQTNAWDYLSSIVTDPLLVQVLSAASVSKMELCRATLPLFTYVHGNAAYIQSSWRLKSDGGMLVERLVRTIEEHGGQVLMKKKVTELIEEDGRIVRAVCQDGQEYAADWFISNIHPSQSIQLVRNSTKIKKMYRARMENLRNTFGIFTTQLVLRPGSISYFNHNKYIFTTPQVWDMALASPDGSVQGVMVSCKHPLSEDSPLQVDILTPMLWSAVEPWQDSTLGHRPASYLDFKSEIARQSIALAETQLPGLTAAIEQCYTSSPLTWRDYNCAPQGTAFGLRKDYSAPLQTILSPRTQVPNLLLTGQNLMLHGLHGVTMTAGYTCQEINTL